MRHRSYSGDVRSYRALVKLYESSDASIKIICTFRRTQFLGYVEPDNPNPIMRVFVLLRF